MKRKVLHDAESDNRPMGDDGLSRALNPVAEPERIMGVEPDCRRIESPWL